MYDVIAIINEGETTNIKGLSQITVGDFENIIRAIVVSTSAYRGVNKLDLIKLARLTLDELETEVKQKEI